MKHIYIASPYSGTPTEMNNRYFEILLITAQLMSLYPEHNIYSPIVHSHPIAGIIGNQTDHEFWVSRCVETIRRMDELWIVKMDGWDQSRGIRVEKTEARQLHKPLYFIDSLTLNKTGQ